MSALDGLRIASPCPMKFSDMQGDERKRFCAQCRQNVYNLSAMSEAEAVRLVTLSEQRICVTFFKRADGTVITSDCEGGFAQAFTEKFSQRKRPGVLGLASAAVLALLFAATVTLFGDNLRARFGQSTGGALPGAPAVKTQTRVPRVMMGKIDKPSTWNQNIEGY